MLGVPEHERRGCVDRRRARERLGVGGVSSVELERGKAGLAESLIVGLVFLSSHGCFRFCCLKERK